MAVRLTLSDHSIQTMTRCRANTHGVSPIFPVDTYPKSACNHHLEVVVSSVWSSMGNCRQGLAGSLPVLQGGKPNP